MKTFLRFASAAILITALPMSAFAQQDSPTAGLVMATPGSVALIWHVNDSVALRPEFGFNRSTATGKGLAAGGEQTLTTVSPGFSALFYFARWDALRTYVSPRYIYSHASSESESPGGTSESTASSHSFSGSIGAEYLLHRRFGVFGELGLNFSSADSPTTETTAWNQRTAVGATLYF